MSDDRNIPLPRSLQEIVGSLLFASPTPLTAAELRQAIKAVEPADGEDTSVMEVYQTCTSREIDEALKGLSKALDVAGCGFQLVCSGGAYRLQTTPSCGRYVRAMLKLDRPSRLGRASLETLAIIAYRQPITKSEIEEIRGVDVTGNIKTLMDLQLIRLVGKSELPGHPFLYGTTPLFLEHFGLASLQQLNEIDPTLQRSNPRAKAAMYKKAVTEKTELEKAADEAEKAAAAEVAAAEAEAVAAEKAKAPAEAPIQDELIDSDDEEIEIKNDSNLFIADDDDIDSDDDDIFIDDTPDEFDDDDDEDSEDEGDEFDDEDEDEGDEEDEN